MDTEHQDYFRGSLSQSVVEFFRDYGVDCLSEEFAIPQVDQTEGSQMGSVVGFKGQNLRGGLAFVAPASLVAKMLPVPKADTNRAELQLRDWTGEIANQLAGRFKNKLSARAYDFEVGTAVCFRGMSIRLSFMPNNDGVSLSYSIDSAGIRVFLDCSFVTEGAPEEHEMRIVPEGDVVIF